MYSKAWEFPNIEEQRLEIGILTLKIQPLSLEKLKTASLAESSIVPQSSPGMLHVAVILGNG